MKIRLPLLLVFVAACCGGCATTSPTPEKGVVVSADQTEVITPVGSHMKVRVLKGQRPLTSMPTESVSGERLNDALLTRDGSIPPVPVR